MKLADAALMLQLRIRVREANQQAFRDYLAEALPVFEARGDCQGFVYVDAQDPECFNEVFYYADEAAYAASERAIRESETEIALLVRWRALLEGPPEVSLSRRWAP